MVLCLCSTGSVDLAEIVYSVVLFIRLFDRMWNMLGRCGNYSTFVDKFIGTDSYVSEKVLGSRLYFGRFSRWMNVEKHG